MPPGGRFGHSGDNPTIFAADELLYVLDGVLMLSDPATGETQRAAAGEAVFFRRNTWHHGRAASDQGVRVLEFFSPTPAAEDGNCLHLEAGDAAVLPPGTPRSYLSAGDSEAVWLCGIGPGWTNLADIGPERE